LEAAESKPGWRDLPPGCILLEPASSRRYLTGDWRTYRPVIDDSKCTKCGMCWVYCPDSAIYVDEDGRYRVDYNYCKGCGICSQECAPKAISMVEEVE